jgi:hypothetical protein
MILKSPRPPHFAGTSLNVKADHVGFLVSTRDKCCQKMPGISIHDPQRAGGDFDPLHDEVYKRDFRIFPEKIETLNPFRLAVMGTGDGSDVKRFLPTRTGVRNGVRCR